jgi:hypothetical protein
MYMCRISDAKPDYAKGSGSAIIAARINIISGEFAGMSFPHNYSLQMENPATGTKDALWRIKHDLRATNKLPESMVAKETAFDMTDDDTAILLNGAEGWADIIIEKYNNRDGNKLGGFVLPDELENRRKAGLLPGDAGTVSPTLTPAAIKPPIVTGTPAVKTVKPF